MPVPSNRAGQAKAATTHADDPNTLESGIPEEEHRLLPKVPSTRARTPMTVLKNANLLPQDAGTVNQSTGTVVMAGLAYCAASVTMVLVNKIALSQFSFNSPTALLWFQCFICVALVWVCELLQLIKRQQLKWQIVKLWLPVNVLFVLMIWTSFFAIRYLTVPMLTVLKNLSNLFTIWGDYLFYNRTYSIGVWSSLGLMALSAICGAITDMEFNFAGYMWQLVNCLCTSGYSLYLRGVMDLVADYTDDGKPLSEVSMVYLNNLLSLPLLLVLMLYNGEAIAVFSEPALHNRWFQIAAIVSGLVSFGISFASLWFLSSSTPTTYSLVGSLNKVPIAMLSFLLFKDRNLTNVKNLASVGLGLVAGVVFVHAKQSASKK